MTSFYVIFGVVALLGLVSAFRFISGLRQGLGFMGALRSTPVSILGPVIRFGKSASAWLLKTVAWLPLSSRHIDVLYGNNDASVIEASTGYFGGDPLFTESKDPLVRGDLLAAAERRWPKSRYPVYWLDAPPDMERDVESNSRLADGSDPAAELTAIYIDDFHVQDSVKKALIAAREVAMNSLGLRVAYALLLPAVAFWFYGAAFKVAEPAGPVDFLIAASAPSGFWLYAQAAYDFVLQNTFLVPAFGASVLALLICALGVAHARFARDFWNLHRNLIVIGATNQAEELRRMPKDAVGAWHYLMEVRREETEAFVKSVQAVNTWDSREGVELGSTTGMFGFRGLPGAPLPDQAVVFSDMALAQHLAFFGASGLGKTSKGLKPIFKKRVAGILKRGSGSIYVSCGKGVLGKELRPIADSAGLLFKMLGVGPGALGVDLFQGVRPQVMADIIYSVLVQTSGEGGNSDPFWPERAAHFMRCAGYVLEAWERTAGGRAWVVKNRRRAYSPLNVYRATQQSPVPGSILWTAIEDIRNAPEFNDPALFAAVQDVATEGLYGSIEYILGQWLDMALSTSQTLPGILSNVSKALGKFETNEDLLLNFASGERSDFSIPELWSEPMVVATNLNTIEHGLAGKLVLVFLQTLVYIHARQRELKDRTLPRQHPLSIFQDEKQDLITADLNGVSDINFINVCRSSLGPGGGFVIATQTLSAIELAVGKVAARNYFDNFSNLISMQQSDRDTIDLFKTKVGSAPRFHISNMDHVESRQAQRMRYGVNLLDIGPARLADIEQIRGSAIRLGATPATLTFEGYEKPVKVDLRFLPPDSTVSSSAQGATTSNNITAVMSAKAAAFQRAEDKNDEYLKGMQLVSVLDDGDFAKLGDTKAIAIWKRGGHTRMDIINLPEPML